MSGIVANIKRCKQCKNIYDANIGLNMIRCPYCLHEQVPGIVTLSIGVPWKAILIPEPVYFVIYPSIRGGFNAQAIPRSIDSNECKLYFPKSTR